jgi:hypothetical protein
MGEPPKLQATELGESRGNRPLVGYEKHRKRRHRMPSEKTIAQIISIFSEEFAKFKMTESRRNIWKMMTDGIPDEALLAATYKIVAENDTWPPTIGMLRTTALALISGSLTPPTGVEAWESVIELMRRSGGKASELDSMTQRALCYVGGLYDLRNSNNEHSDRARFIEAFDIFVRREKEERELLPAVRNFMLTARGTMEVPAPFEPPSLLPWEIEASRIQEAHDRIHGKRVSSAMTREEEEAEMSRIQAAHDRIHGKKSSAE